MGLFSKKASSQPTGMSSVPMDAPGVLPSTDANIRQADPKVHQGGNEKISQEMQSRLADLRVDDSTLVKGMTYENLTLFEKKSVLVSPDPHSFQLGRSASWDQCIVAHSSRAYSSLTGLQINRALDELNVTGSSILGLGRYQWCIFFRTSNVYILQAVEHQE